MPEWVNDILKQSPILGLCMLSVYTAGKYLQATNARFLDKLEKSHAAHLASKNEEIARLREDLDAARKDRDKLQKMLNQLREKP
jgi:septal ring factor EnvC (AmiA/AmiB activator)